MPPRFKDGKIAEPSLKSDQLGMLEHLGVIPARLCDTSRTHGYG